MSIWLRVRGAARILGAILFTLIALALPGSGVAATPSPAGATLVAACFIALAVPTAVGWGCARGDPQLESVGTRPVHAFDLILATLAVGITTASAVAMQGAELTHAGSVAGRALLVYLGFMLLSYPLVGWRIATLVPVLYLLAVAIVGRGEDVTRPAPWAWIAADGSDGTSWLLTIVLLGLGIGAYAAIKPRRIGPPADD